MFWHAGIRGEVQVIVKVDFFLDFNKFRQTSCGVKFFYSKYLYSINSVNSSLSLEDILKILKLQKRATATASYTLSIRLTTSRLP